MAHHPDPSLIHPREMRWSGRALTESEREVFPVPDGPITRSIASLIDNERGSERGVDKDLLKMESGGQVCLHRWDRSLLKSFSVAEVTAAAFRACLSTRDGLL